VFGKTDGTTVSAKSKSFDGSFGAERENRFERDEKREGQYGMRRG